MTTYNPNPDPEDPNAAPTIEITNIITKELTYWANITDMLYQDHKLYFLINDDSSTSNNLTYSRGEVYMKSLVDGSEKSGGLVDLTELNSIKTGIYSGSNSQDYENDIIYSNYGDINDLSTGIPAVYEFDDEYNQPIQLYAPYNSSLETSFAGPQKFISVNPKKLVITDSGIAFFTDDNGVTKYKEVNRVVYVDIDDFTIEDSKDMDLQFLDDYKTISLNYYVDLSNYDSFDGYKWNEANRCFEEYEVVGGISAHIIKEN